MACCWTDFRTFLDFTTLSAGAHWHDTDVEWRAFPRPLSENFYSGSPEFARANSTGQNVWRAVATAIRQFGGRAGRVHHNGVEEVPLGYRTIWDSQRGGVLPVVVVVLPEFYFLQYPETKNRYYVTSHQYGLQDEDGVWDVGLAQEVKDRDPNMRRYFSDRRGSFQEYPLPSPPPGEEITYQDVEPEVYIDYMSFPSLPIAGGRWSLRSQWISNVAGLMDLELVQKFDSDVKLFDEWFLPVFVTSGINYGSLEYFDEFQRLTLMPKARSTPMSAMGRAFDIASAFNTASVNDGHHDFGGENIDETIAQLSQQVELASEFEVHINGNRFSPERIRTAPVAVEFGGVSVDLPLPIGIRGWSEPETVNALYDVMRWVPVQHWSAPTDIQRHGG